ncbi:MAG: sensor histidine kinase [Acidobacteriota bacterium]
MPFQPPHAMVTATDMSAFVLGLLAVMFGAVWWRDREQGLGWLALSFGLMALVFATNELHLPKGPYVTARLWSGVILCAIMLMAVGIFDYLYTGPRRRWRYLLAVLAPGMALLVAYLLGIPVLRSHANLAGTIPFIGCTLMAFSMARVEKGAGHALVGLALLSIPLVSVVSYLMGIDAVIIRYYGSFPLIFFGLTLFTTSLLRKRRALQNEVMRRTQAEAELTTLNQSLEDQVAQRTADLQNIVAGLESFNRNVSHDLRGPLGGIAGTARVALSALEAGDNSLAKRVLPIIADQADTSGRLVGALLDLAHVGDDRLSCRTVHLTTLVDQALAQLTVGGASPLAAEVKIHDLPQVHADPNLLLPVFVNLIGNAHKFSRLSAHPCVEIGADIGPYEVTVFVRDNGVGFSAEAAARLFDPFVRLHGPQFEGNGVGLSIVRRAVERHGGRVWAESRAGGGATFFFTLPRPSAGASPHLADGLAKASQGQGEQHRTDQ